MLNTKIWDVRDYTYRLKDYPHFEEIIQMYQEGKRIVLPTETVYGLGGSALNEQTVKGIYEAKGRPSDNPLIIHIYDTQQLDNFVTSISETTLKLMEAFWPGPITFILPLKKGYLCERVTGGLNSVAVRMPSHPVARYILKTAKIPIAAPSANLSGRPSPTTFEHTYEDLNGRVDGIIHSTPSDAGLESTVIDCTSFPYRIARPGTITRQMLNEILPNSIDDTVIDMTEKPIAPGMKYKHYAPDTPLVLIEHIGNDIREDAHDNWNEVAFIIPESLSKYIPKAAKTIILSRDEFDIPNANKNLYAALHQLDELAEIKRAYMYSYPVNGDTEALRNRMTKAANHQVVKDELL
ncbi:L-threonylcarbamoyladenylate synthase [Staphylococcus ratti]|uniref:Threonylcarbamoyl-AMP synthase n=1 Tax=Staphylococcus ratti TaxID=2892440 RepID=A0ABY3PEG6_9STAP|nr:L-threonylcarbamoyladenylate synthase [Staphylococcus ratti]UEX90680.1 threonylcarbamoyl-AMP synthase [Staphylococcus ratti]